MDTKGLMFAFVVAIGIWFVGPFYVIGFGSIEIPVIALVGGMVVAFLTEAMSQPPKSKKSKEEEIDLDEELGDNEDENEDSEFDFEDDEDENEEGGIPL